MSKLLSLRAYAKHRGVSLGAVQKAIKSGRVTTIDGQIDPENADATWHARTDPSKQRKRPPEPQTKPKQGKGKRAEPEPPEPGDTPKGKPDKYWDSKAAREYWESQLAELKFKREQGELLSREDAEAVWDAVITSIRGKVLALPAEIANRVSVESDPIACEQILKDACYRALSELSAYEPYHEPWRDETTARVNQETLSGAGTSPEVDT